MQTITEEQIKKFEEARNQLLHEIYIFKEGINFTEKIIESEIRRKQWIEVLIEQVNNLNIEQIRVMKAELYGYTIGNYNGSIEEVFLKEFSRIVPPFNTIIPSYQNEIYKIFMP